MKVRVYVEGGGDHQSILSRCREGFGEFFRKFAPNQQQPKVIACGGRNSAFDDFKHALTVYPDEHVILLVDAEDPVKAGVGIWAHLHSRDGWVAPDGVTDDRVYLMVQCMESWFLADRTTLIEYYGADFKNNALPGNPKIEEVWKRDVFAALVRATRNVEPKGEYHKTRHGFELLRKIDPAKVRLASPHVERLCAGLTARLLQ